MNNANMPAMPQANEEIVSAFLEHEHDAPNGLTKREYFAAMAMQGLTNSAFKYMAEGGEGATDEAMKIMKDIGVVSCDIADALLAELERKS